MNSRLFQEFLESSDTLRVYHVNQLIFSSVKDRLFPLLDFINQPVTQPQKVVICDKLMGNAAALLAIRAGCREVYSPLGSQLAVITLGKYRVKYHLTEIVPYIQSPDGQDMCPMEKMSTGKEPQEFYELMMTGSPSLTK
jgi:hypothetical protein